MSLASTGGSTTVTVTSATGCAWTAASPASFITISSGASGSGNGSVVLSVAADSGANRTGTVTIAGQTFTVNQTGAGIIAAFNMFDPSATTGTVSACLVRGPVNSVTTCPLTATARINGPSTLTNWAWTVQYTYGGIQKTQTQSSGTIPDFQVSEFCGLAGSAPGGAQIPLSVSLTVTDSNGVTATATSGTGTQPALLLVAYPCGS